MGLPSNFVAIQGLTVLSADNLNTLVQWTLNLKTLRNFLGASNHQVVYLLGAIEPNDGGDGHYYWDETSSVPDDGATVIVPNGYIEGAWIKMNPTQTSNGGTTTTPAPPAIFVNSGTVTAACGVTYVALGAFTLRLPATSTVSPSCRVHAFAYAAPITITLAQGTETINGGTPGAQITIPQGWDSEIVTDGAGHYYATLPPAQVQGPPVTITGTASSISSFQVDQDDPSGATAGSPQTITADNTPNILHFPDVISNVSSDGSGDWNPSFGGWLPPAGRVVMEASVVFSVTFPPTTPLGGLYEFVLQIINNAGSSGTPTGSTISAEKRLNPPSYTNATVEFTLDLTFIDTTDGTLAYQVVMIVNGQGLPLTVVTHANSERTHFVGSVI